MDSRKTDYEYLSNLSQTDPALYQKTAEEIFQDENLLAEINRKTLIVLLDNTADPAETMRRFPLLKKKLISILNFGEQNLFNNVSENLIEVILNDKEILTNMFAEGEGFLNFIHSSLQIAALAASSEHAMNMLQAWKPKEDTQNAVNSCTARAIMKVLLLRGNITDDKYNRITEFDIFREISFSYDKGNAPISDPRKITKYLQSHGIEVIEMDIKDIVAKSIEKSEYKDALSSLLGIFKDSATHFREINNVAEIDISMGDITLLVLTRTNSKMPHTVFGIKTEGKFIITDPSTAEVQEFNSFQEFATNYLTESELTFSGVMYVLPGPKPRLEHVRT